MKAVFQICDSLFETPGLDFNNNTTDQTICGSFISFQLPHACILPARDI